MGHGSGQCPLCYNTKKPSAGGDQCVECKDCFCPKHLSWDSFLEGWLCRRCMKHRVHKVPGALVQIPPKVIL